MSLSFNKRLQKICNEKNNHLCIGLDIDPDRFPRGQAKSLEGMETEEINTDWQEFMSPYFEILESSVPDQSMLELEEAFHLD